MSDPMMPAEAPLDLHGPVDSGVSTPVRIYVCTLCNDRRSGPGSPAGKRLCAELAAANRDPHVEVVPTECLSICRPLCALTFASEGKWTQIYAVPSDADVKAILEGARLYARSKRGLVPWLTRTRVLNQGIVARVPPSPR